jgi:uncharacterized membrane protein YesL
LLLQELLQFINFWRRSFSNSSLAARVSTISVSIIAAGAYTNVGLGKSSQYVHLICMYVLVVITLSMLYILKKPVPDDEDVDTCLVVSCIFSPKDFIE